MPKGRPPVAVTITLLGQSRGVVDTWNWGRTGGDARLAIDALAGIGQVVLRLGTAIRFAPFPIWLLRYESTGAMQ